MILIYSQQITSRLHYIVKFLFTGILQVPYAITSDVEEFKSCKGPKINYSFKALEGVTILPRFLLFNTGIDNIHVEVFWEKGIPVLFHECADVDLPFDPFAASFYMVSRYEEYVIKERDVHGRFISSSSVAGKNGFLHIPVVDRWAYMLRGVIEKKYPNFIFPNREYSFISTIDVDSVAVFRGKPFIRIIGATVKAFLRADFAEIAARWKTLVLNYPDPYNTFDFIKLRHNEYRIKPVFFFQVGKRSKHDGNISHENPVMQRAVKDCASYSEIGIHPSYRSNSQKEIIKEEIRVLENIISEPVVRSRQHFLRMELPHTYQTLISCEIKEEYSMGFPNVPGFRAGTCTPFPFYNLLEEKETELMLFPLAYMDASAMHYQMQKPLEALQEAKMIIDEVKKVNGTFILLWHNQTLSELGIYKGWKDIYPQFLNLAVK